MHREGVVKERMFKLHRHKSHGKSGERIDFSFYNIQALQVPKGWDKLSVSLISVETKKTISKSGKAAVQNGNCRWNESLSESIWISQDDAPKELEQCIFKLIVAMGSARSGILGEATINLGAHISENISFPISMPLKNCSHGTIIQLEIQCRTPRTTLVDEKMDTNSSREDANSGYGYGYGYGYDDLENKSDVSGHTFHRSMVSSSSNHLDGDTYHPGELSSRETSFSASASHLSFDSMEGSFGRENFSPQTSMSGIMNNFIVGRQDSTGSQNSAQNSPYPYFDSSRSNHSTIDSGTPVSRRHIQHQREDFFGRVPHSVATSNLRTLCTPKSTLEAEEVTIEEHRAEARMWERNARKLMLDLELLRKEFSDQSKQLENLQVSLDEAKANEEDTEHVKFQANEMENVLKELDDELKFQKESNYDLALQLKKTQESNLELVSVLQEMEETIETQKMEIDNLSTLQSQFKDEGKRCNYGHDDTGEVCSAVSLPKALGDQDSEVMGCENIGDLSLIKEIEALKGKVKELERDCNELTEENLELLYKLKESRNDPPSGASFDSSSQHCRANGPPSDFESEVRKLKSQTCQLENEIEKKEILIEGVTSNHLGIQCVDCENNSLSEDDISCRERDNIVRDTHSNEVPDKAEDDNLTESTLCFSTLKSLIKDLESRVEELSKKLLEKTSQVEYLETQILDLQKLKTQMEESIEIMRRESNNTSKFLDSLRNEMNSHVSAKKNLERKSLELESGKRDLELHLSELEGENTYMSERISGLEAQLRYLTDARESNRLELQNSESHVTNLQEAIRRMEIEMDDQKVDMKQKLKGMQKQWLEAQEECEYLKKANPKLQSTTESLIEECTSLQTLNRDLRHQNLELHKRCTLLESDLRNSRNNFSECSNKINALEANLSSMLEEIACKEKIMNSELEALHHQNKEHKEKLVLGESLLNQMYLEKACEAENLRREVSHLSDQISLTHDEKETAASEAVLEMHNLRADKCKLEAALQELEGKFEFSENNCHTILMECEEKVRRLTAELYSSKQYHEVLVGDNEKLLELSKNVRSDEEKLKETATELESKFQSSEYEKLQLAEEISSLKIQLQKITILQDEVLVLKSSVNEMKFENERLRTSLLLVSSDYEELKAERNSFVQKISTMQKDTSELEDCRRCKVGLQEKILRLEGDLAAREALSTQEAELKNELGRVKRANSQLQWKIKQLEEEKEDWLKIAQSLEDKLNQKKEVKPDQIESYSDQVPVYSGSNAKSSSVLKEMKISEKEEQDDVIQFSEDPQKPHTYTDQLQQYPKGQDNLSIVQNQRQVDNKNCYCADGSSEIGIDTLSRIQFLETELAEALEANDMYRSQLKSFLCEGQIANSESPKISNIEDKAVNRGEKEENVALLEAELKELRERYFEMSLKYAEVEAQREQLVIDLKAVNNGRRWFS